MAIFPRIQSPCPYKGELSAIMDGDICRLCKREVFDLTALSDSERVALIANCADEVCVTYKFPLRAAVAAAMTVAAMGVPMAAAAQDFDEDVIVVGGITDPANVKYVADPRDSAVPELPVVYDDQAAPATTTSDAAPAGDASASDARPDLSQAVETQ